MQDKQSNLQKFESYFEEAKRCEFKGYSDLALDKYLDTYYYYQKCIKSGELDINDESAQIDKEIRDRIESLGGKVPDEAYSAM